MTRYIVTGTEDDVSSASALINSLKSRGLEVDDVYRTSGTVDAVKEVVRTAVPETQTLLLLSSSLPSSHESMKLDELLAERSNGMQAVQAVLLDGSRSPLPEISQLARIRGAIAYSEVLQELAERAVAVRVAAMEKRKEEAFDFKIRRSAWYRFGMVQSIIRSGIMAVLVLATLFLNPRKSLVAPLVSLVAIGVGITLEILAFRRRGRALSGSGKRIATVSGVSLVVVGLMTVLLSERHSTNNVAGWIVFVLGIIMLTDWRNG